MITPTTDIEQDHSVHNPLTLILEKYCFAMTAIRAVKIVCSAQCGVLHKVVDNTGLFFCDRHEIVAIYERFSGFLLVVTVATGIEEDVVCSIDFGV